MSLSSRLSNGWTIATNSFKVLKENKELVVLPILSGLSLILIVGSFATAALAHFGWDTSALLDRDNKGLYEFGSLLVFYIINYFVVVFFNTALVHCVSMYFKGEKISIGQGIQFSMSRLGAIFSWALFAGTVGAVLKMIQERSGIVGKIITGFIGITWAIATFFVVPIIANENLGPVDALKRSSQLMKEKWGESIGAGFSFGLLQLGVLFVVVLPGILIAALINIYVGIALIVLGFSLVVAVFNAAKTIFITAVYHNVTGDPVELFNQQFVDNLFMPKK